MQYVCARVRFAKNLIHTLHTLFVRNKNLAHDYFEIDIFERFWISMQSENKTKK